MDPYSLKYLLNSNGVLETLDDVLYLVQMDPLYLLDTLGEAQYDALYRFLPDVFTILSFITTVELHLEAFSWTFEGFTDYRWTYYPFFTNKYQHRSLLSRPLIKTPSTPQKADTFTHTTIGEYNPAPVLVTNITPMEPVDHHIQETDPPEPPPNTDITFDQVFVLYMKFTLEHNPIKAYEMFQSKIFRESLQIPPSIWQALDQFLKDQIDEIRERVRKKPDPQLSFQLTPQQFKGSAQHRGDFMPPADDINKLLDTTMEIVDKNEPGLIPDRPKSDPQTSLKVLFKQGMNHTDHLTPVNDPFMGTPDPFQPQTDPAPNIGLFLLKCGKESLNIPHGITPLVSAPKKSQIRTITIQEFDMTHPKNEVDIKEQGPPPEPPPLVKKNNPKKMMAELPYTGVNLPPSNKHKVTYRLSCVSKANTMSISTQGIEFQLTIPYVEPVFLLLVPRGALITPFCTRNMLKPLRVDILKFPQLTISQELPKQGPRLDPDVEIWTAYLPSVRPIGITSKIGNYLVKTTYGYFKNKEQINGKYDPFSTTRNFTNTSTSSLGTKIFSSHEENTYSGPLRPKFKQQTGIKGE